MIAMNYPISEYLLIIQPSEDVTSKILNIKTAFAETYQCPKALQLKPQLTLIQFSQYDMAEPRFFQRIKALTSSQLSFKIDIDGFGSHSSHTIFLEIQTKNNLFSLIKELKQLQANLKLDSANKPHFISDPNITIANKLQSSQYEKAWLEYSNTPFQASFLVNELLFLKRGEGKKGFKVIGIFPMMNEVSKLTQASLF